MNIVFFMQDTGTVFGAERATIDLALNLRQAGERPLFFLIGEERLGQASGLRDAIARDGFPIRRFSIRGRLSWRLAREVAKAFREVQGDVLHVLGYKAHVHAWLAGVCPRVSTVHGWLFRDDWKERLYGRIELACLRRCDRVIALSRYYESFLRDQGVAADRLVLIPSGLREVPVAVTTPCRPMHYGMMGRFSEEKNHRMFLQAAAKVHAMRPEARFLIAGQGPLEEAVRAETARLGLGHVIDFCGYRTADDFFADIGVYVIPSKIENLPYSILEAMARGRPVIGTRVGGIPDLIADGQTGRLVDPEDIEALARAMLELADDPVRADMWGRAGRAKVEAEFDAGRSATAHIGLYRQLI